MRNIIVENSDRFKSVFVGINMLLPLNGETNSKNALLAMVLKKTSNLFESEKELERTLANLYNTSIDVSVERINEIYNIQFGMELLNVKYMGEQQVEKARDILCSIILNPKIEGGMFDVAVFEREKKSLMEKIKEERDDKKKYALKELEKDMFKGTAYGVSSLGTLEDIEKITNEELVKHYYNVLNEAKVVVTVCGNLMGMEDFAEKVYDEITSKAGKQDILNNLSSREVEKEIITRVENQDIAQSVLCIGAKFNKVNKEDMYKIAMFNTILGGTPASKLFQNVREKESLAYFAKSTYNRHKHVIYMFAGVDPKNNEKAKDVMLAQVESIKNGDVSELEFNAAKQNIISGYKEMRDSKVRTAKTLLNNDIYFERSVEIKEMINEFEKITLEDVINISQNLKVTNIFLLGGVSND